ncbi:MFS transporter [Streptomyces sp. CRN 30]|uniref:MFS transporter n=1 Tax=Streptomyces sp. CRN 30 TaxID=3075613 RepID=UPI002A81E007|nr:MFS transporter [Streptomyces sp. CRN 30]
MLTAQLMLQLDAQVVTVALPQVQTALGFSAAALSWVPNAYALAFGGLMLLGGRLGDTFGRVRVFNIGTALFAAASLGGALTAFASWRWGLLINVPVGIAVVAVVHRLVRESAPVRGRVDIAGAVTATLGSLLLVYGFIHAAEAGWAAVQTVLAFVLAVALLVAFGLIERRAAHPLLDLTLLRHTGRATALMVMGLIVGVHFSLLFILVQYLQRSLGMGALTAGLAFLPLTGTILTVTQFVPAFIRRVGPAKPLVAGSLLVAVSFLWFAQLDNGSTYGGGVLAPLVIHSIGAALVFTPATVMIMDGLPPEHTGSMSGFLQMVQQVSGSLGIAVIVAVYVGAGEPDQVVSGIAPAFYLAGAISTLAVLAALVALVRRRSPRRSATHS